jgi:hypothetical protein
MPKEKKEEHLFLFQERGSVLARLVLHCGRVKEEERYE